MKSILVIDDDLTIRSLLRRILEQFGYEVLEACNGQEGIEMYQAHPTDLVITDIHMPEKNGFTVIAELRHDYPDLKIIAVSGGVSAETKEYLKQAHDLGAVRTLPKPFDVDQLIVAVRDILGE